MYYFFHGKIHFAIPILIHLKRLPAGSNNSWYALRTTPTVFNLIDLSKI